MKIAILQGPFLPIPPVLGGAVEKIWFLIGKNFALKGNEVFHISRKWDDFPISEFVDGVHYKRIRSYSQTKYKKVNILLTLLYTIRAIFVLPKDIDIIVSHTYWAPIILPLLNKAKLYVSIERYPKGQLKYYRSAARLRAPSDAIAKGIKSEMPNQFHHLVKVIPNPLPFEPSQNVSLQNKKPIILYSGRIHPEKGLDLLINACFSLPDEWSLMIVGPWKTSESGGGDKYFNYLKDISKNIPIQFTGPINELNLLNQIYQDASIFVYPSIAEKGEAFGLAPLEAMAWGCVPIVSDLDCFKDFIFHQVNGFIFNHRDKDAISELRNDILLLINDSTLRENLAKYALNVRLTHSPNHIADLFLADFEYLMKKYE